MNVRRQSGTAVVAVPVLISAAPAWAQSGEAMAHPGPAIMVGLTVAVVAFLVGLWWGRRRRDPAGVAVPETQVAEAPRRRAMTAAERDAETDAHYRIISELTSDVVYAY
ncbi:MAG TPA: hypothetical protein DC046_05040, partial [Rhodospirillaceae bacterium]|nr:hypothetical protein [Rhodospirillaceae bacterium]